MEVLQKIISLMNFITLFLAFLMNFYVYGRTIRFSLFVFMKVILRANLFFFFWKVAFTLYVMNTQFFEAYRSSLFYAYLSHKSRKSCGAILCISSFLTSFLDSVWKSLKMSHFTTLRAKRATFKIKIRIYFCEFGPFFRVF